MVSVAEYLRTEYKEVNISGGYYDLYHRQDYSVSFFDVGESITEQIINYNFNYVQFYCDSDGKLSTIRIHEPNLSLEVGDYPIIDSEQALELLKTGHYITTVPYEMPGVDSSYLSNMSVWNGFFQ